MNIAKQRKIIDEAFGAGVMSRDGINYSVACPMCKEKKTGKRKLVVKLDDYRYHCWVCECKGKSIWRLIARLRPDLSTKILEFDNRAVSFKQEPQETESLKIELPEGLVFLGDSTKEPDALAAIAYLRYRGIADDKINRWRIHAGVHGKFRRHVFFPSFDADGKINYFLGRAIDETQWRYKNAIVPKSSIIFNEIDIDWNKEIILVEGVFDAMKCPDNCIPLLGSALSKSSLLFEKLASKRCKIKICLDSDLPQKAYAIAKLLAEYDCDVRIAFPPLGMDLGDMSEEQVAEVLSNAKNYDSYSLINYKINTIKSGSII